MMHLFLLVSVLFDHTSLTSPKDMQHALIIWLGKISILIKLQLRSDWGTIGDQSGNDWGSNTGIDHQLIEILISKQYWLYLRIESKTIAKLFDTGFTCDGFLYTYVYNVLDGHNTDTFFQMKSLFQIMSIPSYMKMYIPSPMRRKARDIIARMANHKKEPFNIWSHTCCANSNICDYLRYT